MALLTNQKRLASIKCTTDCYFGTLTKDKYLGALWVYEESKMKSKFEWLSSIQLFKDCDLKRLNLVHLNFEEKNYKLNEIVYK